jgi:hypothetical protein
MKKIAALSLEDKQAYIFTVTVLITDFVFIGLLFLTH